MNKFIFITLFLVENVFSVCLAQSYPYQKESIPVPQRVKDLLSRMTLEEKIAELNLIPYYTKDDSICRSLIRAGKVGAFLKANGAELNRSLQEEALKHSRLGIPLIFHEDVIHGYRTITPIPLAESCSWNPELVEQSAAMAAREAAAAGIQLTYAPMVDISYDPRWGRIMETSGEDAYLCGELAAARVRGFQGNDLTSPHTIAACVKHFAGYGAVMAGRDYQETDVSLRKLQEIYLPPFQAAINAGVASVMCAYTSYDGEPLTMNYFMNEEMLRKQMQFKGLLMTDWTTFQHAVTEGAADNGQEAAERGIKSGIDMDMSAKQFIEFLPELVRTQKVPEQLINRAAARALELKFRLGLFDNPYVDEKRIEELYAPSHLEAAKKAAVESAILLKNEKETLPLQSSVKTVAVVGPMANAPYDQLGTWIFDGDKTKTVTPLKAIKELVGDKVQVIYEPGLTYSRDKNMAGVAKAAAAAARADVILAFVGEEAILSGEAHCLADLNLQGAQSELVAALAKTGKPVVTVVMAGRPLTIGKEVELSSAVLYSFHPGTMGGPALADLLWGKAVPSGKTPVTFPKMVGQIPVYYAHNSSGRPATRNEVLLNDIPLEAGQTSLGCTSFYMDAGFDPLYPFGYGLSYTTFKYDNVKLSSANLKKEDVLTVTFDLENTGKYEGTEVAQLYVQDKFASVTRPVRELKRFARITLKPGEKKNVSFELPISELAFWNIDMVKTVEVGDFALWVAPDSQSGEEVFFRVVD